MPKKKKVHPIIRILEVLFVIFIALFIANSSGYYEGKVRNKVAITNDKIEEFEQMLANGDDVDLNNFLANDRVDYSNKLSNFGEKLTMDVQVIVKNSFEFIGNIFKSLF